MTPTKLLIGQILVVFAVMILGVWTATQWAAAMLAYQPQLGAPWLTLGDRPVYPPWRLFDWWFHYEAYAPAVFNKAGLLAGASGFLGCAAAIIGSLWRARQSALATTYGSSRWAHRREVEKAGLFGDAGVFLGRLDHRYLRHDGPEHVMAFAPTRSGKGVGLVVPTLLSWLGSAVVHDIKGENWTLTAGWRAKFSHCLLLNPTDPRSARYNPLLEVRKGPDEVRDVQNIADVLVDPVAAPQTPMYLDALLVDTPLTGGIEPRLGDQHLRTLTILGFPNATRPGLLDALNHQAFAYRWSTRFICLDKSDATKVLTRIRRQWFNKRKSVVQILREVISNEPVPLTDSDADNKLADADLALQALGGDHVAFGYLTTTITVADGDRELADEKVRLVERIVNGLGFTCVLEQVNAVEAWLGSLPGHVYANVRQPLVHTLNLAHLMPLSSVWAGQEANAHLGGPPTFHALTSGATPFRFSTHIDDVGHTLVVGPTGSGKSVLLALLALQFRRYPGAQVYIFDKRFSARAVTLAMGGQHYGLSSDSGLAFQPLVDIDRPGVRAWASEWLGDLLVGENIALTPEIKEALWSALTSLAGAPREERTLTGLSMLLQSNRLKAALAPYTLDGPFGRLIDAAEDGLAVGDVLCFETEALVSTSSVVGPVLTYLFHRLEARFDGRPTLLVLDEAWKFLDEPLFAARIREWLKELRKRNVSVVFATQSLADIEGSSIAPAIIDGCAQRVFLANDRAAEPLSRAIYQGFGLNDRQIELIARATPKRHYYLQSRLGNRLFELGLGPIALTLCGASDPATQTLIDKVLEEHGEAGFAAAFLAARGLDWAAPLAAAFDSPPTEKEPTP